MGLDLAWRTIVGQHRGALSVTSEPADTRFTICLPARGHQPGRWARLSSWPPRRVRVLLARAIFLPTRPRTS